MWSDLAMKDHGDLWHGYPQKWQLLSLWSAEVSTQFCKHQKAWKETGPATRTIPDISTTPCVNVTRNQLKKTDLSADLNLVY